MIKSVKKKAVKKKPIRKAAVKKSQKVKTKKIGPQKAPSAFDSEGSGYDYATAKKVGNMWSSPDNHWYSRVPSGKLTGMLLKGRKHPTYKDTVAGEVKAGNKITKGKDGRYYSLPKKISQKKRLGQSAGKSRRVSVAKRKKRK